MRVVLCLVLLLTAASARAQGDETPGLDPSERSEYEELTKKGILEYELGHWAEAKAHFARAHALYPNARTLRALGLISFEMRSYVEALDWLERALASHEKPLTEEMRNQVSNLADDARSFVARIWLVLEPADADVFVDGQRAKLRDQNVLLVDPGEHELRVEAAGHLPEVRPIRAAAGQSSELKLALSSTAPEPQPTPAFVASAEYYEPRASWWTAPRTVAVGLGAAGVVALGVGVTAGLLALSAKSESDSNCDGDVCNSTGSAQRDTAVARADIASVGFIAGGALLAAGALTFVLAPDPERSTEHALRVQPGLASLALTGRL
jgi:hypothetical protein